MSPAESITDWLNAFQTGNRETIRLLWKRYFHRMTELARVKLGRTPRGGADEEDVSWRTS